MLDRGGVAVDAGLDPRSAHFARCVRSLLAGDGYRTSGVDGGKRRRHRRAEGGHTSVNLQAFAGARPNGQDSRGWRAQRFSERFWACWVLAGLALAIVLLVVGWRSGAVSFLVTLFGVDRVPVAPDVLLRLARGAPCSHHGAGDDISRRGRGSDRWWPAPTLSDQVFAGAKRDRIRASLEGLPSGAVQLTREGLEWRPDPIPRRWGVRPLSVPWSSVRGTQVSEHGFLRLILVDGSTVDVAINRLDRVRAALRTLGIPSDD